MGFSPARLLPLRAQPLGKAETASPNKAVSCDGCLTPKNVLTKVVISIWASPFGGESPDNS